MVEFYGDQIDGAPGGHRAVQAAQWRRSSFIVLERNPGFRECVYDAEPDADDAEGQALLARFKGRRLPMVDRVEISIIEEAQPRWLTFLNGEHDLLERLPTEFATVAVPNGKLAPNLAKRACRGYPSLASDVDATYFNMEDPVVGGYTPDKVALRRAIGLASTWTREIRLARAARRCRRSADAAATPAATTRPSRPRTATTTRRAPRPCSTCTATSTATATAGASSPTARRWCSKCATQPDQRAASSTRCGSKDMDALGVRIEFKPAKWPENLKAARAGKLQMWRVGRSAAVPDGQAIAGAGYSGHTGGQNLARFGTPSSTRSTTACRRCPTARSGSRCSRRQAHPRGLRAVQVARAPHLTDLAPALAHRLPAPAVLAGLVAVRRHRRRGAGEGAR